MLILLYNIGRLHKECGEMKLNIPTLERIEKIITKAHLQGRQALYEFEVYEILNLIGLETPRYFFCEQAGQICEQALAGWGDQLVAKIVSPQIAHKQKLGGVKVVQDWRGAQLPTILATMEKEVLSHFPQDSQPEIKGFLLVEFVNYSPALGNETMLGFRQDREFGPVVLISKGGSDAEFFAKHYDRANLLLPPLNTTQGQAQVEALHIAKKFKAHNRRWALDLLGDALAKISALANQCEAITALDVNPFVLTENQKLLAIDGYGELAPPETAPTAKPTANTTNLAMFFEPKSIAVIGVSADLARQNVAREIAMLLHKLGREQLYLVNPRGGTVAIGEREFPLYKSLNELPKPVDLAVYAAPARFIPSFLPEASKQAKAAIIISGLPAGQDYSQFVQELDKIERGDLRIMGPNCMGVYNAPTDKTSGVNTLFIEEERLQIKTSTRANTALLTQSGALGLTALDNLEKSGIFQTVVSFGNQYDVKITDLTAYFARDPGIDLIALYLEGFAPGEGRLFFELAQQTKKPILAYKAGRTKAGAEAAASHTAAMSGDYEVFRAACLQAGVVLAEELEDFYHLLRIFSLLAGKKPRGLRTAGVVNAGFEAAVAGDALQNLIPARLDPKTIANLAKIDPHGLISLASPFLDVTPMADDDTFSAYVEALLADENTDCVFVGIVPHSNALKSVPHTCRDLDSLANRLVHLFTQTDKPLVASVNGGRLYDQFADIMKAGGIPVYRNIRAAIHSLNVYLAHFLKPTLPSGPQ